MSRQYFYETITWATADGTAVTNTTTETIVFPNITFPANYMNDGRRMRIRAFGKYNTGTGPPTVIFGLRWGGVAGTLLAKTAAITTVASQTAGMWDMDIEMQTRSNGATGTIMANGTCKLFAAAAPTVASATGGAAVTAVSVGGATTPAAVTVDLTADTALSLTATWSASSTSHSITGLNYAVDSCN